MQINYFQEDTMPRRARLDAPGTLHHVMVRGIEKRRIVNDVNDRKNFVKRLGELSVDTNTAIYACFCDALESVFPVLCVGY